MADAAKRRAVDSVVSLVKELRLPNVRESKDLGKLSSEAAALMKSGPLDKAFHTAAQLLAEALHIVAEDLIMFGSRLNKEQSGKTEVVAKDILKVMRSEGDKAGEAMAQGAVVDMYLCSKMTSKALKAAQGAIAAFQLLGDKKGEAKVMRSLINAHVAKASAGVNPQIEVAMDSQEKMDALKQQVEQEMQTALDAAKDLVELFRGLGDRRAEAESMSKVAELHLIMEEPETAVNVSREVRSIYQELDDPHGEAIALYTVVNAYLQNPEDYDDALTAGKDALKLFVGRDRKTDREDKKAAGEAYHSLAQVYLRRYELADALDTVEQSVKCFTEANEVSFGLLPALLTQATIHNIDSKCAEAVKAATQAALRCEEVGDKTGQALALHTAGYIELDDLMAELDGKPEVFTAEHSARLDEGWRLIDDALLLYQELKHKDGEASVLDTAGVMMDKARAIHVKVAEPTKTIYMRDPKTSEYIKVNIYDTEPVAGAGGGGVAEEEEDEE